MLHLPHSQVLGRLPCFWRAYRSKHASLPPHLSRPSLQRWQHVRTDSVSQTLSSTPKAHVILLQIRPRRSSLLQQRCNREFGAPRSVRRRAAPLREAATFPIPACTKTPTRARRGPMSPVQLLLLAHPSLRPESNHAPIRPLRHTL